MHQQADVALMLPDGHRRGVVPGAGQPGAIRGAGDLDEPLGPAADRADLMPQRGTAAPGLADSARRAEHSRTLCVANSAHLGFSATPSRLLERTTSNYEWRTVLWVVASKGSPVFE